MKSAPSNCESGFSLVGVDGGPLHRRAADRHGGHHPFRQPANLPRCRAKTPASRNPAASSWIPWGARSPGRLCQQSHPRLQHTKLGFGARPSVANTAWSATRAAERKGGSDYLVLSFDAAPIARAMPLPAARYRTSSSSERQRATGLRQRRRRPEVLADSVETSRCFFMAWDTDGGLQRRSLLHPTR